MIAMRKIPFVLSGFAIRGLEATCSYKDPGDFPIGISNPQGYTAGYAKWRVNEEKEGW